jgi:hypothetical protein
MSTKAERVRVSTFLARDRSGNLYELRECCESITVQTCGGACEAITSTEIVTVDGDAVRCVCHPRYVIESSGVELTAEGPVIADLN